jgi:hypothetical protein
MLTSFVTSAAFGTDTLRPDQLTDSPLVIVMPIGDNPAATSSSVGPCAPVRSTTRVVPYGMPRIKSRIRAVTAGYGNDSGKRCSKPIL